MALSCPPTNQQSSISTGIEVETAIVCRVFPVESPFPAQRILVHKKVTALALSHWNPPHCPGCATGAVKVMGAAWVPTELITPRIKKAWLAVKLSVGPA